MTGIGARGDEVKAALDPVIAALRADDLVGAKRLARQALSRGIEHPMLLNLRALESEEAGMLKDALRDLRRAHLLAPRDFAILNACGLTLARMERMEEALNCYDQALALQPNFGPAWFNQGWALERVGEKARAAEAYAKAIEINPDNVLAWASLAFLSASRGDFENARLQGERALQLQPGFPTAILALAAAADQPIAAEDRLRDLLGAQLTTYDRGLALGLLGDALDAQDRPAEAFAAYAESNAQLGKEVAPRFEISGQPTIVATVLRLNHWAQSLDPSQWRCEPPHGPSPAGEAGHVFLMGFPRSGTTLVESALGQHPNIVTLEERETLRESALAFLDDPKDIAALAQAPESQIRPMRDAYWARVAQFGVEVKGKVFIDKHPFNTLKLPIILKLFPRAKILFAVRDPRDVVLSCFRRRFNINPTTYEFLDLARTAANYDGTMRLADVLRAKLPFAEHQLVYERLIENFEDEARAVCAFVGVDWRPELLDFAGRAQRGEVASASAAQISRGLYADGAGQWRRYRAQLTPVLPMMAPWVQRFGYPPE